MDSRKMFKSALLILIIVSINCYAQNHWSSIGPGAGSDLKSIAIHPLNPDIVYIGGDIEGIFKTTDGGNSWEMINNNLALDYSDPGVYFVQNIKFDQSDITYQTLYSCTTIGLMKTTNGGESWNFIYPQNPVNEEDFSPISFIEIDPDNSVQLWLGKGETYANESGSGTIVYSPDGGANWNEIPIGGANDVIHGIYIDPLSPVGNRTIYVSTSGGFFKSIDHGNSWTTKNTGLPHTNLRRLKGAVNNNQLILYLSITTIGTQGDPDSFKGGIYKSSDGAETWVDVTSNLPKYQEEDQLFYYYWKFSIDPTDANTVYTATTRGWPDEDSAGWEEWGIYKTVNAGQEWNRISQNITYAWLNPNFYDEENAFILEVAPSDPNTIYWGIDWMNKSTDGGNTWQQIYSNPVGDAWQTRGLELMVVDGIGFDPVDPDILYVSYDDFGFFRSDDGGNSFKPLDSHQDPYEGYDAAKDIVVDPANGDIYLSRYEGLAGAHESNFALGHVWKSVDKGENWIEISNGLPEGTPELIMDKSAGTPGSRTLYCTIYNHGVYKTTNSGNTWTAINNGLGNDVTKCWTLVIDPSDSQILYIGINAIEGGGAVYVSTDAGTSWNKSASFPAYDVLSMAVNATAGTVYAGATDNYDYNMEGGLYKSTDQGVTWTEIFDNSRIAGIEIDPTNPNKIYAISQGWYVWNEDVQPGIFMSDNGGTSWTNITYNIGHTFFREIKLNPYDPSILFVGTDGGGLWVLNNSSTGVDDTPTAVKDFILYQNYPNPFNPSTIITFEIRKSSDVTIRVFDMVGQEILTLLDGYKPAGIYELNINLKDHSSGIYLYELTSGDYKIAKKMLLLK